MRRIAHGAVGSTNAEALALARSGERGPVWVTAETQTAGRGRRGKVWISEPGNLYATLLLTDPSPLERAPQLSFVAALAASDAIAQITEGVVALKWPNDVLLDGAKVAGILLEGEGAAVAIGIGVNCAHHPAGTAVPATHLAAKGKGCDPESMLMLLADAMMARLAQWDRGGNFAAIRADWLQRAAGVGGDIHVRLPDRELIGRFDGLDEHGRLLLSRDGKRETITAGEVFGFAKPVSA